MNQVEIPKQGYSSGKSDRLLLRTVVISDTGTDLGLEAVLLPHGYQLLDRSSFCSYFHFCKRDTSDYNEIAGCCLQDQSLKSPRNCSEKNNRCSNSFPAWTVRLSQSLQLLENSSLVSYEVSIIIFFMTVLFFLYIFTDCLTTQTPMFQRLHEGYAKPGTIFTEMHFTFEVM